MSNTSSSSNSLRDELWSLEAQVASIVSGGGGGVPTSSNLAQVLFNGNDGGGTDITGVPTITLGDTTTGFNSIVVDGSVPNITLTDSLGHVNVITANGSSVPSANADAVLTTATASPSVFYPALLGASSGYNSCGVDTDLTYVPSTNTLTMGSGMNIQDTNNIAINSSTRFGSDNTLSFSSPNMYAKLGSGSAFQIGGDASSNTNGTLLLGGGVNNANGYMSVGKSFSNTDGVIISYGDALGNNGDLRLQSSVGKIFIEPKKNVSGLPLTGVVSVKGDLQINPNNTISLSTATYAPLEHITNTVDINGTEIQLNNSDTGVYSALDCSGLSYYNGVTTISATTASIINSANNPPATPTLNAVLGAGNSSTNQMFLTANAGAVSYSNHLTGAQIEINDTQGNNAHMYATEIYCDNNFGDSTTITPTDITINSGANSTIITKNSVTSATFNGNLSGTASKATNLAGGVASQIPYQSGANTTAFIANGTSGQYLKSNGAGAPSWDTLPSTPSLASVMSVGNKASTTLDMSSNSITNATTITATSFVGDLTGNATSATKSTNLAGGVASQIPYQSGANTTAFIANGTSGQYLKSNGAGAPSWDTLPVTATPTLSSVLTAGNTATNSIILNNGGTNVITTDPTLNTIVITDGTTTNTIDKNGYTTRNTTANATHYLNFSDSSSTGTGAIQKTAGISVNPSTKVITATSFVGDLSGNATSATNATNVGITSDNTSGTYYIPFAKTSGTGNKPLFIDDTTTPLSYNPSTATLTTTNFSATAGGTIFSNLTNSSLTLSNVPTYTSTLTANDLTINTVNIGTTPSTANVAGRFGQIGLVYVGAVQVAVTGSASAQNLSFANLFNSTYKNYRVILAPTTQVSFTTTYVTYSLQGLLGTGVPTNAGYYGYELLSTASSTLAPLFSSSTVLSSSPIAFGASSQPNKQLIFDVNNVGYSLSNNAQASLNCKSFYSNPGVNGYRDINILMTLIFGATLTGLTIQQSALGVGNNMTLEATVFGYNTI